MTYCFVCVCAPSSVLLFLLAVWDYTSHVTWVSFKSRSFWLQSHPQCTISVAGAGPRLLHYSIRCCYIVQCRRKVWFLTLNREDWLSGCCYPASVIARARCYCPAPPFCPTLLSPSYLEWRHAPLSCKKRRFEKTSNLECYIKGGRPHHGSPGGTCFSNLQWHGETHLTVACPADHMCYG